MPDTFAHVTWNVDDLSDWIQSNGMVEAHGEYISPEEFYDRYAEDIQDAMISAGWTAIESILGERVTEMEEDNGQ